jgi:hemerythrin-like domain-containing protein
MDVGTQLEYFRKEHQDYLRFLDRFEPALAELASPEDRACLHGLKALRGMEGEIREIASHCSSEERAFEEPYRSYLKQGQLDHLEEQHQELRRLAGTWFAELRFATLDRTQAALGVGRQLAAFLCRHITLEEKLLAEIERKMSEEAEQKLLLRFTQAPE